MSALCPDCKTTRHLHGHTAKGEPLWQCWRCAYEGQRMRLDRILADAQRA